MVSIVSFFYCFTIIFTKNVKKCKKVTKKRSKMTSDR